MKKVLVFGTFDYIHAGHIHLLEQAKKQGDQLVIALARDSVVNMLKGRDPLQTECERKQVLEHISLVDEVVLGDFEIGTYAVLNTVQPDVIVVGYDQKELFKNVQTFIQEHALAIELVKATEYHSPRTSTMHRNQFAL